jgi:hypothetical protein
LDIAKSKPTCVCLPCILLLTSHADAASSNRRLLTEDNTYVRERQFTSVAQHKQPNTPQMPVKTFERRVAAGRLLLTEDNTYVRERQFTSVAQHKQPNTPQMPVKTFERRVAAGKLL